MAAPASSGIPQHIEHRIQTLDGRTLAVAEWGDPKGVPVFELHGTPGGRIDWPLDLTLDSRHGIRRLTLDRPGYGESTRLASRTVADIVPDVVAIADALGIERFAITVAQVVGRTSSPARSSPRIGSCAACARSRSRPATPRASTGSQG
jgi:hypothetical protein